MRAWIVGGIAVAFSTVACGKDSSPAASSPAVAALPSMKIVVVERGAEPRTALRYRLKAGSKDSYEIKQTQKNRTGDSAHLAVQNTTTTADAEVLSVDPAGQATVRVSMHDLRAEILDTPGVTAPAALAGFRFHLAGRLSPLGRWTDTEFGIDEDPSGQMKPLLEPMMASMGQMMEQISVQFPSEPVGVGARWRAEGPVKVLGMTISSTTHVTVESIAEGRVVLRQKQSGEAKDQKMEMPPITGDVLEISTQGEGSITITLSRVLPDAMEMTATVHSKMRIKPSPDAAPHEMEISGSTEMHVKRKD